MDVYRVTKGSRRAARRRLHQTSDPLTLIERISPIEPREIRTEKVPFPRSIPQSGVVVLPDDLHGYDRALALAHELGQPFRLSVIDGHRPGPIHARAWGSGAAVARPYVHVLR